MDPYQNPTQPAAVPGQPGSVFTPNAPASQPAAPASAAVVQPWQPQPAMAGPAPASPQATFNDVSAPAQPIQPAQPFVQPMQPTPVVAAPVDPTMMPPTMSMGGPVASDASAAVGENPDKNYILALALSYFFGIFGMDRFYLGKKGTALAKLFTLGGLGIWHLIDLFLLAFGRLHAKDDDRPLQGFTQNYPWVRILAIILMTVDVVIIVIYVVVFGLAVKANMQIKAQEQQYQTSTTSTMTMTSGTPGQGM